MSVVAHGIRTLGVMGAGQMGTGIALVSALRAKVPVVIHDKSPEQVKKSFVLIDKLLAKDVSKGRLTAEDAKTVKDRISVAENLRGLRDVDMVVEVRLCIAVEPMHQLNASQAVSESLPIKQKIFGSFASELKPEAILATNTSSISITKIAASAIPLGVSAASEEGQTIASRVVGESFGAD